MTQITASLLFVVAFLAVGCSSVQTSHDYDEDADFSALETYAWIAPSEAGTDYPMIYKRVVKSTDEVLAQKGFRLDPSAPNFRVAAHFASAQKLRITERGYGHYRGVDASGLREVEVDEYEVGTLVLDIVSVETNALIWRGMARGSVNPTASPEKRTKRVRAAVEKMLSQFPPGEQ